MYSVFLVEDEILIREGIKDLVSWEEYGFDFIGDAPDGDLAWPIIQKTKPDIVITDIKMPFMDGLELSRLIKKEHPETSIIILSGYDDFSYAQQAISIGVNRYLLKPLSKNQLVEVLLEVRAIKDEEMAQQQYKQQFLSEVQEYLSASHRSFFDTLISGEFSLPDLLKRAESLEIDIVAPRYNIVLFIMEEDMGTTSYASMGEIQERINGKSLENSDYLMFGADLGSTAILVKGDEETIDSLTKECVKTLINICGEYPNVHCVVPQGKPVSRLTEIGDCYRDVRRDLFHQEVSKKSIPVDFNPEKMDSRQMDFRLTENFLSKGTAEDVPDFVESYFAGFEEEALKSVMFRNYVILNVQFAVNTFLEKSEIKQEKPKDNEKTKERLADALSSAQGAKDYVTNLLCKTLELRDNAANSRYQDMLGDVIYFMKENYSDPEIGLNKVAEIANMTPTYFSAVFSQEMGKTFVVYLTELRMEKARELLRYTNDSGSEIALQVGYNDPNYFSFLFKKTNGMSPRDYRNERW